MTSDGHINDDIARHNVKVLVVAQAFLGAQMPMVFVVGGLAGQMLAPIPCFATASISVMFFASMITSPILSSFMGRYGRRAGFAIGAIGGMIGALVAAFGLYSGSFPIFLLGAFFTGIYHPSQQFLRFAATDNASSAFRPKAISYVLAGGLVAAVIGPQLVKLTYQFAGMIYVGTYLMVALINAVGIWIYFFLKETRVPEAKPESQTKTTRSFAQILGAPGILVAIMCALISYSLMTLMMTSAPLAIVGCGFSASNAADVVMAHVLAMFVPSFFTGHLIARFGATRIVAVGLCILCGAAVVALMGTNLSNFFGALILLGIGWNFGFIGATSLLAEQHSPEERARVQGLNDFLLIGSMMVASLASGGLLNCAGSDPVEGWTAVAMAMWPALILAFLSLGWFGLKARRRLKAG